MQLNKATKWQNKNKINWACKKLLSINICEILPVELQNPRKKQKKAFHKSYHLHFHIHIYMSFKFLASESTDRTWKFLIVVWDMFFFSLEVFKDFKLSYSSLERLQLLPVYNQLKQNMNDFIKMGFFSAMHEWPKNVFLFG